MRGRVLIVDDEKNMCELIDTDLRMRDYQTTWHTSAADALQSLKTETFDIVLTDLKMPGTTGIELCERIVANRPDIPVIVMTAFGNLETAVEAIRAGAYDFVTKPIEMDVLALAVDRAVTHRQMRQQVRILREAVERFEHFDEILGESRVMTSLFDQLSRIADSDVSVLITGESGTGKELVARALHKGSVRKDHPFVAVNCAALPETLLESELFGHVQGAFTDARSERKGLFLQAEGGTLFLDEVGELPLTMQPKLLRALEEHRVRPVGADQEIPFDVRLVTATNRDLDSDVDEGRFREDLFFRINVVQLAVPSLRARGTDILLLSQHFVGQFAHRSGRDVKGISEAVAGKLLDYSWPGNVRELRNVIERAVALTRLDQLSVDDLPEKIRDVRRSDVVLAGSSPDELVPIAEVERRYILHVLKAVGGNKTLAARTLGLDRKTLYRKLQQFGVADENSSGSS